MEYSGGFFVIKIKIHVSNKRKRKKEEGGDEQQVIIFTGLYAMDFIEFPSKEEISFF